MGQAAIVNPAMRKADVPDSQMVSFVPMSSVAEESGVIDDSDCRPAGELKTKSYRQFADDDLLVAKITPSMENGKAAVARGLAGGYGFGSTEFHVIRPAPGISPDYLFHFVTQRGFRADAARNMTGTAGQLRVPPDYLRSRPLPLPPAREQLRIVAAIGEHFTRLDAAAGALGHARVRLASLRPRLIASLMDLSRIPGLDEDASDVPLPRGWVWLRASQACEVVSSGSTPKAADMFADSGDVPFVKVYNLQFDGSLDFTIKPTFVTRATHEGHLRRSRLVPGDVLINIVGPPLGKVSVVPDDHPEWNMNQAVAAFRPGPLLRSDFLLYLLMARAVVQPLMRTGKATAGQINLNISACRRLWLPIPEVPVQESLVRRLDAVMSTWKATVNQTAIADARGIALRGAVLKAAFAGHLVPQDPDDEPASVLLERIRASAASAQPPRSDAGNGARRPRWRPSPSEHAPPDAHRTHQ